MKEPTYSDLFPIVFFARYQVWSLSPMEIDELLANGWFRNKQYVQTTLGRMVDNKWKPCLMIRIPIRDFVWKKRLRKLMRLNKEVFEVKIQPFTPRDEIEHLWRSFKSDVHKWKSIPNIVEHILKDNHPSSFNTFEVSVFKGSELVAFSLFDKGQKSIGSLEAAYDTKYQRYSLGMFTMLIELEYCIQNNIDYYYPGFYPKDTPMFDYKLRPGQAEFFRPKIGQWCPWDTLKNEDWLLEEVIASLSQASRLLSNYGFHSAVKAFGMVSFPSIYPSTSNYNFLTIGHGKLGLLAKLFVQIAWDPLIGKFILFNKIDKADQDIANPSLPGEPFLLVGTFSSLKNLEDGIKKMLRSVEDSLRQIQ